MYMFEVTARDLQKKTRMNEKAGPLDTFLNKLCSYNNIGIKIQINQ